MGFFNSGQKGGGKGVSASEPKKRGLFRFFDIIARKYSQLIGLNLLYFFCSLPVTAVYFLLSSVIAPTLVDAGTENYQYIITQMSFYIAVFFLMTLGGGPFTAGFCYVIRNYSREEHAFLASDFFEHTKKNLKQSLVITLIDFLLILIFFMSLNFYTSGVVGAVTAFAAKVLIIVFLTIYMISRMYLYLLMVTYESSIFTLIKYSLALALLKLPQNILIFGISILIYSLLSLTPFGFFVFFVTPIFLLSLTFMSQSMYTTAVIDENIASDKKEQKNNTEQIFHD